MASHTSTKQNTVTDATCSGPMARVGPGMFAPGVKLIEAPFSTAKKKDLFERRGRSLDRDVNAK